MAELLEGKILGAEPWRWGAAIGTALLAWLVAWVVGFVARKRYGDPTRAPKRTVPFLIGTALARTKATLWLLVGIGLGKRWLFVPETVNSALAAMWIAAVGLQIGIWAGGALSAWLDREAAEREAEGRIAAVSSFGLIRAVGLVIIWSMILLAVLANLGVEITALVASLGVGGIAIALAAQNVLGDLLASLSIVLDRPFEVGDFIIVGDMLGTVERIGLKTTRIRSLGGEQLIFSNSDLLSSRIRNYKRMKERRIVFKFGLLYSSPAEKVREVPALVQRVIEAQEGVRFDRAHFQGFGASSLDFEFVYWMLVPDYNAYMDTQQAINLRLLQEIQDMGLAFAFPTRTLHLESVPQGLLGGAAG